MSEQLSRPSAEAWGAFEVNFRRLLEAGAPNAQFLSFCKEVSCARFLSSWPHC